MRGVVGQKWSTSGYHCGGDGGVRGWAWGGGEGGGYLVHDVFEGVGTVDGEADEEEVGFGVGEGAQTVVFFLAGCVPEGELDDFARGLMLGVGDVVFEYGGDVFLDRVSVVFKACRGSDWSYLGEVALGVADHKTCLSTPSVTDDDKFLGVGRRLREVCRGGHSAGGRAHHGVNGAIARSCALLPRGSSTGRG